MRPPYQWAEAVEPGIDARPYPSSPATVNKASPNIFIFAPPLRVTVVSLSNAIYLYHRFYDAFVERKRVRLLKKKKRRKKKRKREEATDRKHALILASLVVPISAFLEARRIISSHRRDISFEISDWKCDAR